MTEVVEKDTNLDDAKEVRECRACLKKLEIKTSVCNIFQSWALPWTGMESTIAADLAKIAHVEISEADIHSKVICEPCYHKLLAASSFVAKVRFSDTILRERLPTDQDKVWPKPIQVDKNINGNIFHEMNVEIKQEVLSDQEYDSVRLDSSYHPENCYVEAELGNMEIKVEPEEFVEPPPLTITINDTISLNPKLNPEHKTLLNGFQDYEAIISDRLECRTLTNVPDLTHNEQLIEATIKEEPWSEEEDAELVSEVPLECLLCTMSFNSVTGLKAHVLEQHSYKSVKRKAGSGDSPVHKRQDKYRCQSCTRSFPTSAELRVHERSHKTHVCYYCSRKFNTLKQLSEHSGQCRITNNLEDIQRPVKEEISKHYMNNYDYLQLSPKSETGPVKCEIETVDTSDVNIHTKILKEDCT